VVNKKHMNMRLKYVLLFLLGIMIFPVSAQDKNVDKSNFHAKILFRIGKGELDLGFMNNREVMNSFVDKLNVILADSNYVVDELKIVGAASPDGITERRNIELGQARAEAMKNYICSKVNIPSSLIKLENKGENWEAVRAMVVASSIPYKEEVLQIIDRVTDRNQRKNKLMFLHNSVSYDYMNKNFFPVLRSGMGGTSGKETVSAESLNNWNLLRGVISDSNLDDKAELLKLLDSTNDPHECFEKLKAYKGGVTYDKVKAMIVSKNLHGIDPLSAKNWTVLKKLISTSDMQHKAEVLSVLNTDSISGKSENQLQNLNNGNVYQYIKDHFFQALLTPVSVSEGKDSLNSISAASYQKMIDENWTTLRNMVDNSDMPHKKEILEIIDNTPDPIKRVEALMKLDNGTDYKYICDVYLPVLLYGTNSFSQDSWHQMELLVSSSDMEEKEEVLKIIRTVPISMGREEKLKALKGGEVFRSIQDKMFFNYLLNPSSENQGGTGLSLSYKLSPAARERQNIMQKLTEIRKEVAARVAAKAAIPEKPKEKILYKSIPFLAVKTNILYWGGITSEIKHRDMIPNLELELYAGKHISLNADAFYTYLNESKPANNTWGISGIGVEPRFWFCKARQFTGLYAGVYGAYGDFDVKPEGITSMGHTGNFYEGGLSLGYYQPLSSHWGVEIGGRCGYRSVSGDVYYISDPHYYKQSSFTQSGLKLTGIRLLVTYRFGRSIKIKSDK
jgi:hypothetical protein